MLIDGENTRKETLRTIAHNGRKDWSDSCKENATKYVFLTLGMGVTDSVIIIISKYESYPNCFIKLFTVPNVYLIVVLEFPDLRLQKDNKRRACFDESNKVMVYDKKTMNKPEDMCKLMNSEENKILATYITQQHTVIVEIQSKTTFESIKLTATAARKLTKNEKCEEETEIRCSIMDRNNNYVEACLPIEVQCDGHMNCGKWEKFDEDPRQCLETRYSKLWLVIIAAMIMTAIVVFFMIRLLRSCVPRVGTNFFIFNEDEDNKLNLATIYTPALYTNIPLKKTIGSITSTSSFCFRTSSVVLPQESLYSKEDSLIYTSSDLNRTKGSQVGMHMEPITTLQKTSMRSRKNSAPISEDAPKQLSSTLPSQKYFYQSKSSPIDTHHQLNERTQISSTQYTSFKKPSPLPVQQRSKEKPWFQSHPEFIKTSGTLDTLSKKNVDESSKTKSILRGRTSAEPTTISEPSEKDKTVSKEPDKSTLKQESHVLTDAQYSTHLAYHYPDALHIKSSKVDSTNKKDNTNNNNNNNNK